MNSINPTEFSSFLKLPLELRMMIWVEALPTRLDYQRFKAEIARHPDSIDGRRPDSFVLCLSPHEDFLQLTSGLRGLLGACRESHAIASQNITHVLPINYLAPDGKGSFDVRFARVPFNADGQLCISGLGPAFHAAAEEDGARGMDLRWSCDSDILAEGIQCVTLPEVKHLTITRDPARDFESKRRFMLGWDDCAFNNLAVRMANLEEVALIDEGVLSERQHIDAETFNWMHQPATVVRPGEDDDGWDYEIDEPSAVKIPWMKLYDHFKSSLNTFEAINQFKSR
ncbi:hypothetical protein Daus18300_002314 [Diaporthe australafricana]|uniref:2EXR domain-containing protein n=1 Tax=Diaporthe australafricana TaxID=127596 RepID=A0ABR3XPQ0_9PEZI